MLNYSQLDDYIKKSREEGKTNKELKQEMLAAGYNKKDVRIALGLKSSFFKKIIKFIGLYIIIGYILILINPMSAWVVLTPYFLLQSSIGELRIVIANIMHNKKIDESDIVLPSELTEIKYAADFHGSNKITKEIKEKNPLFKYLEQLKPNIVTTLKYFNTPKGDIILKSQYENNGSYYTTNIYYVDNEKLIEIEELTESTILLYKDKNDNLYISALKKDPIEIYTFETDLKLKRVIKYNSDKIKLCSSENKNLCRIIFISSEKNVVIPLNFSWKDEQDSFYKNRKFPELNQKMLSCLNLLEKAEVLKVTQNKESNYNKEPFYTCITDPDSKPFDFDIYVFEPPENVFYSRFFNFYNKKRFMVYKVNFRSYEINHYSKNSFAYKIYKDIIAGKYKEMQYAPRIDNLEDDFIPPNKINQQPRGKPTGYDSCMT